MKHPAIAAVWLINAVALMAVAYLLPGITRGGLRHRAGRGAGAGPGQRGDPPDPDPADAAGDAAHAGPVHLRDQRSAVLVRRLATSTGFVVAGFWPGVARRHRLQHRFLGAVGAAAVFAARTADERSTHLQLRVFSAQDARGQGQAARHLAAARPAQAEVLLGHLRRGRLDPGRHPGNRARDPGATGFEAAPHLSCVASTRAEIGAILEQYKASGHPPHRRAARRPALGRGDGGRAALRQRAGARSSASGPATGSTSRSAATPSTTRRRATPRTR